MPMSGGGLIKHCQLPLRFDAERLAADLSVAEAENWTQHFVSQNYRGDWNALPLRSVAGSMQDIHAHPHPAEDFAATDILRRCNYFQQVLAAFQCPLMSVRLMRLGPGSEIKQHNDPGTGYEFGELRLHIPIVTSPEVEFYLDDERIVMLPGECWYLNFALPHRVVNAGKSARVHLVIDCQLNPWLDAMFLALGFSAVERCGTQERLLDNNIAGLLQLDSPAAKLALKTLQAQKAEIENARRNRD
jgi:quercetin dioxygenase-like cupin family protein